MREYLESCLARIDAREAQVGAWCDIDAVHARAANGSCATTSDRGLLRGIPFGVKDIINVEGFRTTNGSPIYATAPVADNDATVVAMMRAAGGIALGKTVSTELAGPIPSQAAVTKNPHNLHHTPGGSSSGSAAAVADGHVPIAIGTQTAGSVIRPAAYCGVFALKPSFGAVARGGVKLQSDTLDTVGVFTRSVEDLALWFAAVTSARAPIALNTTTHPSTTPPLRIGMLAHLRDAAEPDMVNALAEAGKALAQAGVIVTEASLPPAFDDVIPDQRLIQSVEMSRYYAPELHHHRTLLSEPLATMLEAGARISRDSYRTAMARADLMRQQINGLFDSVDAWLLPAAPGAAPYGQGSTGDPLFNRMVSLMHLPAINIPAFSTKSGLPLGLQLVGAHRQDEKLLQTAAHIDAMLKAYLANHSLQGNRP